MSKLFGFAPPPIRLLPGDCLEQLAMLPENSVDSVVTDPPYHFASIVKRFGAANAAPAQIGATGAYERASRGFMGKEWDGGDIAFRPETWAAVMRVLKPGGHLLAFGSSKGSHRMACAIEDAGFEIRDTIMWLYGTGFPKSHDVSKGVDAMLGAERKVVSEGAPVKRMIPGADQDKGGSRIKDNGRVYVPTVTEAGSAEAAAWEGWGTALKPAHEPIVLARKPLIGTVAANVLAHGTGALNIDACRVPTEDKLGGGAETITTAAQKGNQGWERPWMSDEKMQADHAARVRANVDKAQSLGRFPANVLHDGSDEVMSAFPQSAGQQGDLKATGRPRPAKNAFGDMKPPLSHAARNDTGSASRFFWSPKASKADRADSKHPTVKPVALMRYLCRLVTPPGGVVLDPFAGSGTTGQAAREEGFGAILIEREAEYQADIRRRLGLTRSVFE